MWQLWLIITNQMIFVIKKYPYTIIQGPLLFIGLFMISRPRPCLVWHFVWRDGAPQPGQRLTSATNRPTYKYQSTFLQIHMLRWSQFPGLVLDYTCHAYPANQPGPLCNLLTIIMIKWRNDLRLKQKAFHQIHSFGTNSPDTDSSNYSS